MVSTMGKGRKFRAVFATVQLQWAGVEKKEKKRNKAGSPVVLDRSDHATELDGQS